MKKKSSLFRKKNIKRQVKRRRYRYLLRGIAIGVLVLGLGWGVRWGLASLDLFSLKNIVVQGDYQSLSEAEVLRHAGVSLGTNLFQIDLNAIHASLKKHDHFKEIQVHRRLPNTLVIKLSEYRPELLLHTGRFYYLDEQGEIFKDITETRDSRDFVVLTGINEESILMRPEKVRKIIRRAIQLKQDYQKTEFAKQLGLSEIHYEKNIGFTLYPEKQKYSIKFGNKDFGEKTKKLTQVLAKLQQAKVRFSSIDLNYPGKVLMTL